MCFRTSLSLSILQSISSFRAVFFCSYFPFWVLAVSFCLRFALMVGNSRFELVQYSFLLNFQASDSVEFQLSRCGKCVVRFSLGSHFVSRGLPPAVLDAKGGDAWEADPLTSFSSSSLRTRQITLEACLQCGYAIAMLYYLARFLTS